MNTTKTIPAQAATVIPATVEVRVVRIGAKQLTKAVWNQLPRLRYGIGDGDDIFIHGGAWEGDFDPLARGFPWPEYDNWYTVELWGTVAECSRCGLGDYPDWDFSREASAFSRHWRDHRHVLATIQRHTEDYEPPVLFVLIVPLGVYREWDDLPQLFIAV